MNNQDQAQPEEQTPAQKAKEFLKNTSKPKFPKFLLILLGLVALALIGEGIYYLYLTKYKTPSSQEDQTTVNNEPEAEVEKYFEGVKYYEEVDGEKKLLTIEGYVEKIDTEEKIITLSGHSAIQEIAYTDEDIFYLVGLGSSPTLKKVSLANIQVGLYVAYNPVDESVSRQQASWAIHKQ
jgi:hypothetical protein